MCAEGAADTLTTQAAVSALATIPATETPTGTEVAVREASSPILRQVGSSVLRVPPSGEACLTSASGGRRANGSGEATATIALGARGLRAGMGGEGLALRSECRGGRGGGRCPLSDGGIER